MSLDTNGKPLHKGKCRACGTEWNGSQLIADPLVPNVWTCGDACCGGTCDLLPRPIAFINKHVITIQAVVATADAYNESNNDFGSQDKVTLPSGTFIYCSNQYYMLTAPMEVDIIDRDYSFYRVYHQGQHLGYLHRNP